MSSDRTTRNAEPADMDQLAFGDADFAGKGKRTRKERFLPEMEQVEPRTVLVRLD